MRLKIGTYIRVSTDEQAQVVEGSLDSQKHRLMSFVDIKNAQESGWGKIVDNYVDEGLSAKDTRRPAFQRMMSDIRKGKINLILVTDLSRLSRNILDFCLLLEDLKKVNAKFLSMKEQFDTSTPAGEMMVFNMINLAQFERKQTSERVSMNFHSRALRGLSNGGPVPLGYEKDPDNPSTYTVNEIEAVDVREIFRIFLEERTCKKTIRALEKAGIKPKEREGRNYRLVSQGRWSPKTIWRILRNAAYVGLREINVKHQGKDPDSLKPSQLYQVVKASWPPIIDREDFDEVQKVLGESELFQRQRIQAQETRIFLLTGLLRCAECGASIGGAASHGVKQAHRYYVHRKLIGEPIKCRVKRFRADEVEKAILEYLDMVLERNGYLDGLEKKFELKFEARHQDLKRKRASLEMRLVEIGKEIDMAFDLHSQLEQSAGVDLIKERLSKLSETKSGVRRQLEEIALELDHNPNSSYVRQKVEENIVFFHKAWKKATPYQQKSLINLVFDSLAVAPEEIGAYYKIPSEQVSEGIEAQSKMALESNSKATTSRSAFHNVSNVIPFKPLHRSQGRTRESVKTIGAAGMTRTCNPLVRSQVLYPIELRPRMDLLKMQTTDPKV